MKEWHVGIAHGAVGISQPQRFRRVRVGLRPFVTLRNIVRLRFRPRGVLRKSTINGGVHKMQVVRK